MLHERRFNKHRGRYILRPRYIYIYAPLCVTERSSFENLLHGGVIHGIIKYGFSMWSCVFGRVVYFALLWTDRSICVTHLVNFPSCPVRLIYSWNFCIPFFLVIFLDPLLNKRNHEMTQSANITTTARRLLWSKCLNGGQACIAPNHVLVHEKVVFLFSVTLG